MKKLRYCIILLGLYLLPGAGFAQQDPQYSLYMFDKMALNPAAAGVKDALEATVISRLQWVGMQGAPVTNAVLLQDPLNNKRIAWGVEVMNDRTGPASNTVLQGNYAYNVPVGNGKLAMGLGLQVSDYSINWSQIDMPDKANDFYTQGGSASKFIPDADAGFFYSAPNGYLGFSASHLLEPKITNVAGSDAYTALHAYLIGGRGFELSKTFLLEPSFILQWSRNAPPAPSVNINALFSQKLWVGISLKPEYGLVFLAAYRASDILQIGYAYDLGVNGIGNAGGGSHELSLTIDFGTHKLVQLSPRYL